jgi:hypothetical protein
MAFVWFLASGAVLMTFLFFTVHQRSGSDILAFSTRFHRVVQVWIENGYFKHGGLAFTEAGDANPNQVVWRSSSMAFLQGAHLLERLYYLVRGLYSYRLMALHNQIVVLVTASLLALLGMRLSRQIGVSSGPAFVLGLACQAVYQTFPQNLYYFWELLPTTVIALVAAGWLLFEEDAFENPAENPRRVWMRSFWIFLLVWIEPVSAMFIIATFLLTLYLMAPTTLPRVAVLRSIVRPAIAGIGLYAIQLVWVRYRFPHVTLEGSGFMFRTGLDGSTQYVRSHWDLLTRKWPVPDWPINFWKPLFLAGSTAVLSVLTFFYRSHLPLRSSIFVIAVSLGLYVPLAFSFFQAVAIHPYGYDIYLLFPLVLALFAVLPAALEATTGHRGVFVWMTIVAAWCFSWMHLRTYAMQFPLVK